jgi:glycosyltransferase involved in cell wall biosynthesis
LRAGTWRDAEAFRHALARCEGPAREAQWVALGDAGPPAFLGGVAVERRAAETDPARMALWYRAADVYVHPARADTFPLMVLESLACGTPVIASDVGGIPEQVTSSRALGGARGTDTLAGATGAVVRAFDGPALAAALNAFFALPRAARGALGDNAAREARLRFDIQRAADEVLRWMRVLADRKRT